MLWWLKVNFTNQKPEWPSKFENIKVLISENRILPIESESLFRVSPIFPLFPSKVKYINSGYFNIIFYSFKDPFRILGKVKKSENDDLKWRTWFSTGLCSVILIYEPGCEYCADLLESLSRVKPTSKEVWNIQNDQLIDYQFNIEDTAPLNYEHFSIDDYSYLNSTIRTILDEFCANIRLVIPKIAIYFPSELDTFYKLNIQVNILIKELVYLTTFKGDIPNTLDDCTPEELKDSPLLREKIFQQNIDRIVQINSALGYVATQALSGCTPILERRSLIRRHSLLGVGSAILALNKLVRSIEFSFSQFPIENIVLEQMEKSPAIQNLKIPYYSDFSDWERNSINQWQGEIKPRSIYPKLSYFSGRLGFRETEYTVSIPLHSISHGVTLDWSLLTVTHEMLHGHVRNLLTRLFDGGKNKSKFNNYYENYQKIIKEEFKELTYADSIRSMILFYCAYTIDFGSLTRISISTAESRHIINHSKEDVLLSFEREFRNINEIFVHILDLHYNYAGRLKVYIPLIWRSWSSVPHVRANLRHYILRTLITIASIEEFKGIERFKQSLGIMLEIFEDQTIREFINGALAEEVCKLLNLKDFRKELMCPFKASLVLVDLVSNLLKSTFIKNALLKDQFTIIKEEDDDTFESSFEYRLSPGFHDEIIESPSAYLLGQMVYQLRNGTISDDTSEYETTITLLAMASNY